MIKIIFLFVTLCTNLSFANNIVGEEWLSVYLLGQKVGYGHTYTKDVDFNGEDCYEEYTEMMVKINRGGMELTSTATSKAYVSKDFTPRYFKSAEKLSNIEKTTEGKIENRKLKVKIIMGEQTIEKEIDFPENTYLDDSISDVIKFKGIEEGKEYSLNIFLKEALKIIQTKVKIEGKENVKINDKEIEGIKINTEMLGIQTITFVDKNYRIIKSEYKDLGMVLLATAKEEALNIPIASNEEDILALSSIESNVKFDKKYIKKLRVKIKHTDFAKIRKNLIEGSRQKFIEKNVLEINSEGVIKEQLENKKFVEGTFYEQADDKDIINTAKEIKGKEKDSYKISKKIMEWVYKNINKKNFNIGFAGAKEVLNSKEGDCTEHSVLMSALLKSLGIPTKVVGGVVYFNGRFYYHMWVKVFVAEGTRQTWINMDPTLNQAPADATHIKLAEGILNEEGLVNICLGILPSLKSMSLEVISYE